MCFYCKLEPEQLILAIFRWFALLRLISVKLLNVVNNPFNIFKFVCRVKRGKEDLAHSGSHSSCRIPVNSLNPTVAAPVLVPILLNSE